MIAGVTHDISLGEGICIGYGAAFVAVCSCGWTGQFHLQLGRSGALQDGQRHVELCAQADAAITEGCPG